MAEIKHIDTKYEGPRCMHCGKWLGITSHIEGRTSWGMPILKRSLRPSSADEATIRSEQVDYYLFCDHCFSVLDMNINDFILYPRVNHFVIKKED